MLKLDVTLKSDELKLIAQQLELLVAVEQSRLEIERDILAALVGTSETFARITLGKPVQQ